MNIWAQRVINLNDENAASMFRAASVSVDVIPQEFLIEAKASRTFAINPALQSAKSVSVDDIVTLQLFEGKSYTATVSDIVTDVNGNFTLTLKLPDYPYSFAIITTSAEGKSLVTVSIYELGQSFGSRFDTNSNSYLIEIDKSKIEFPDLKNDAVPIPIQQNETKIIELTNDGNIQNDPQLMDDPMNDPATNCGPIAGQNPDVPAVVDLLVVYTPAAASTTFVSQRGGINSVIATMMAFSNTCFSNSQTGITLQLAHSAQVDYTEPVPYDTRATLYRLRDPSDGYMDDVHALRKQYNADLVQLLTIEDDVGGIAFLGGGTTGSYSSGFSVCQVTAVVDNNFPLSAHEIGHNMGLGHGATMIDKGLGIFDYSFGWTWNGNTYVNNYGGQNTRKKGSVMCYWNGSNYADGIHAYPVPYFSNPSVVYDGGATGDPTQADAARSLREVKHVVAYYSDRIVNSPAPPTNVIASNPTNNGATFSWNAVSDVTTYRVINPTGSYNTTSNTFYTVNNSGWFPEQCTEYPFSIRSVNECGDVGDIYTSTFRTFCPTTDPIVTTLAATNTTTTTATLNKTVTPASDPIIEEGFRYRIVGSTDWLTSTTGILTGLNSDTQYQFYAYATTASNTFHGRTLTFNPACDISAPTNVVVSNPIARGATFSWDAVPNATSYRIGGAPSYYTTPNTTYTIGNFGENMFPSTCTNYQFNIRAVSECGDVSASYTSSFFTFCPTTDPAVVTLAATNITTTTATLNKTVTPASDPVIEEGFRYRATGSTDWLTSANGILTGLDLNTQYQFYVYATTASNTFHGSTLTFKTPACDISAPTNIVVSTPIDNGATFSWDAVDGAVEYNVVYGGFMFFRTSNTTYNVNYNSLFSPCSTYNVTIQTTAECGERASSPTISFTTKCATDPTVTTSAATSITQNSATLNKTITANGAAVTSQGFKYKEMSAATWQTSSDGSLTGLSPNTQYKFYAYAITDLGTFNGRVLTFTTLQILAPTVVTQAATNVTCSSATLNKSVTAGTETITEQGFEYRVSGTSDWQISDGNLTNLTASATYQFRAYAKSASGTTYGSEFTFTAINNNLSQTITFPTLATKIYGDEPITLPQATSAGLTISYHSSNENVATVSGNILTIKGAGTATITASQSGNCDYLVATSVSQTLTVTQAPLKITAEDKTRHVGEANPEFTLTYNGFRNDENENVLAILPIIFCAADINSPAGFYPIELSDGLDNNYQYTLINGVLEVIGKVGIDNVLANQLKIFPNPAQNEIFIESDSQIEKVEIYSLTGVLIKLENNFTGKISISALPRGVYLLKVYTDKASAVSKIVKE